MKRGLLGWMGVSLSLLLLSCRQPAVQLAVLSDLHIQDTSWVRPLEAQLRSTRLYNENYMAAIAALDDVARRGIRNVLLLGDLTDNGQPQNVELVARLLQSYTHRYGMRFYAVTGNHDPARPFTQKPGKDPFVKWGFSEIHQAWASLGFSPQKDYLYWETPFSTYSYPDYSFEAALASADWGCRRFSYSTPSSAHRYKPSLPDGSYLVEPAEGIWLLAIDASVYPPLEWEGDSIILFGGAQQGYESLFEVKPYLLPWIKKVSAAAHRYHKQLIAFSHYPMLDYTDGRSETLEAISLAGTSDTRRFPSEQVAAQLADAGISFHLAGHIHMNAEEVYRSPQGHTLRNVQVPSTAGYYPAYKILTVRPHASVEVETVPLKQVPGFDTFFPCYRTEREAMMLSGEIPQWDGQLLLAPDYAAFCKSHLRELVRLRYLPYGLKPIAAQWVAPMTAAELFSQVGLEPLADADWTGFDLLADYYALRMGGALALTDISPQRLEQYERFIQKVQKRNPVTELDVFLADFSLLFSSCLAVLR